LVDSLIATVARTPPGKRVRFEARIDQDLRLPIDRTDLAEVLGNLLENAARHAGGLVRVTARPGLAGPPIAIEDDGKGLSPDQLPRALQRGVRLDQRGEGAGLGLAIVQDLLDAYRWQLDLTRSELGGLKATIAPKLTPERQPLPAKTDAIPA
jgi:signal transduction histidine kinase